jgi:hypothetical protein
LEPIEWRFEAIRSGLRRSEPGFEVFYFFFFFAAGTPGDRADPGRAGEALWVVFEGFIM